MVCRAGCRFDQPRTRGCLSILGLSNYRDGRHLLGLSQCELAAHSMAAKFCCGACPSHSHAAITVLCAHTCYKPGLSRMGCTGSHTIAAVAALSCGFWCDVAVGIIDFWTARTVVGQILGVSVGVGCRRRAVSVCAIESSATFCGRGPGPTCDLGSGRDVPGCVPMDRTNTWVSVACCASTLFGAGAGAIHHRCVSGVYEFVECIYIGECLCYSGFSAAISFLPP